MKRDDLIAEPVDEQLRLPEGRLIAYCVYGVPDGKPVHFFHGFPGSRLQAALVHARAVAAGVEGIAADVFALADPLGYRRFAVLGVSCGGPHALATAKLLPQRITAVGLLAGIGPMDRPELRSGRWRHCSRRKTIACWRDRRPSATSPDSTRHCSTAWTRRSAATRAGRMSTCRRPWTGSCRAGCATPATTTAPRMATCRSCRTASTSERLTSSPPAPASRRSCGWRGRRRRAPPRA